MDLRRLVARIQTKIISFSVPVSAEKYIILTVDAEKMTGAEFFDNSELMEDLYNILPLTVESDFRSHINIINCQFGCASDLKLAEEILELVFS